MRNLLPPPRRITRGAAAAFGILLLTGPALSILIEGIQRVALPHRAATVNDIVANSIGATAGVVLAIARTLLFAPRSSQDLSPNLEAP